MPMFVKTTKAVAGYCIPEPNGYGWGDFLAWCIDNDVDIKRTTFDIEPILTGDEEEDAKPRETRVGYCLGYALKDSELEVGSFVVLSDYGRASQVAAEEFTAEYMMATPIYANENEPF